jgi:hypothetical protein
LPFSNRGIPQVPDPLLFTLDHSLYVVIGSASGISDRAVALATDPIALGSLMRRPQHVSVDSSH